MIDEELYQLAADELNSDRRKSDIWARACALASDDHDEARYLYTNLRVEEMLAEREAGNDPVAAAAALNPDTDDASHTTAAVIDHSEALNPQAYEGLTLEPIDLSHLADETVENNESEIRISSMRPGMDASKNTDKLTDDDLDEAVEEKAVADVNDIADDVLSADEIDGIANVDGQDQVSSVPGSSNLDMDAATDIDLNALELGLNDTVNDKSTLSFDDADLASLGIGVEKSPEPEAPRITSLDALFDEVDDRAESHEGDIVDADIVESESSSSLVPREHQVTIAPETNGSRDAEFTREMERQAEDLPGAENDVVVYTSKLESELPDMLQDENPAADFDDSAHDLSSVPDEVLAGTGTVAAGAGAIVAASAVAREKVKADYADKNDFRDDIDNEYPDRSDDDEYRDPIDLTDTGSGSRYAIYEKDDKTKAIRMGVSWTALFFTLPWLLYRRLFGTAILYTVLWLVLVTGLVVTGLSWLDAGADASNAQRLLTIGFGLLSVIGLLYMPFRYGNTWRATKLEKRGYDLAAWVRAKSSRKALNAARRASALA